MCLCDPEKTLYPGCPELPCLCTSKALPPEEINVLKALSGHCMFPKVYGELNTPECLLRSLYVQYIFGRPLFEALKMKNEVPSDQVIQLLMWQMGYAVEHMHSLNILHRNINRTNIIVNSRGQLKLVGVKFATVAPTSTNVPCWRCHRAPEMDNPAVPYGYPVDYFAMGATFFTLIYRMQVPEELLNIDVSRPLDRKIMKCRRRGFVPIHYAVNVALVDLLDKLLYPFPDGRLGEDIFTHPFFENAKLLNQMMITGMSKTEFKANTKR